MGWLKKKFKQVGKKLKKFFKSDVGKAIGTIALAVAGFYTFGPAFGTAAGTAGQTAVQTGVQTGIPTAASVATAEGSKAALLTAAETAGATASTAGQTALQTATQTAGQAASTTASTGATTAATAKQTLGQTTNEIARNVMQNANAQVAAGAEPIINPNLTDAVGQTIDANEVLSIKADPRTTSRVAEGLGTADTTAAQGLQAEYSKRGLQNLADATQLDITAAGPPETSLLAPEMPVETFDTTFVDGPSNLGPSSETLAQRTSAAGAPKTPSPDIPEKSPFFSDSTKEYAAQVGVGTTTSLLTGAILGPGDEPESGGGMLISYDKAEAPAGNYVADVSKTYQQNGGMPLTFDMYTKGTVPMYGPSSPNSLANNPFIYPS